MGKRIKKHDEKSLDPKRLQGEAIKERLSEYYTQRHKDDGLSTYTLRKQLYAETGMDFTENTISAAITPGSNNMATPNIYVVIGLCRLWNLDYARILAPHGVKVDVFPTDNALMPKAEVLSDKGYFGTFYGYMNTKNTNRNEIYSFVLKIEEKNERIIATLDTSSNPSNVDGEIVNFHRVFTGTPILMNKSSNVYMVLSDMKGDFYSLYFSYRKYNTTDGMYFRKGICVTSESSSDELLLENFVLFKRKISKEKARKYIPGMLKLNDDYFEVTQDDLQELLKDEEFAASYSKYSYLFEGQQRVCYPFKTSQITSAIKDRYNQEEVNEAFRVLFMLKAKAKEPNRIHYENEMGLPGFAKTFLQR